MSSSTRTTASVTSHSQDEGHRIARERLLIEQARASIAAGDIVTDDEVDAWLDHMVDRDRPMPIPEPGYRRRKVGA